MEGKSESESEMGGVSYAASGTVLNIIETEEARILQACEQFHI